MKVCKAIELARKYGRNTTLGELVRAVQGDKIHRCPKCNGSGMVSIKYNAYPSGLPDSGWVEDWKYKNIECDLCHGDGYTEHEYNPKWCKMDGNEWHNSKFNKKDKIRISYEVSL